MEGWRDVRETEGITLRIPNRCVSNKAEWSVRQATPGQDTQPWL